MGKQTVEVLCGVFVVVGLVSKGVAVAGSGNMSPVYQYNTSTYLPLMASRRHIPSTLPLSESFAHRKKKKKHVGTGRNTWWHSVSIADAPLIDRIVWHITEFTRALINIANKLFSSV